MKAYTEIMKNLYTTGKDYIWSSEKAKQPIVKVDKTATIYEAKAFDQNKLDPKRCIEILAKFIYLFNQGEPFSVDETTKLFFSITKLLQSEDPNLRRLIYTFVKEMSDQPSIFVITSSLLKDIHHKDYNYRRNALRVLPMVLDSTNLMQAERYIKELMNDADAGVVSAALLSGLQLYGTNEEVVRRWAVEVSDRLKNKDAYVQYHALALIGEIKKRDVKYLQKTVQAMNKDAPRGLAGIQHLRMYKLLMDNEQFDSTEATEFRNYVLKQLKNADHAVVIEAAKIACESSFFSNKQLLEVVKVLEKFLDSEQTAIKYTVLKIYNSLLRNSTRKNLVLNVKQIEKVLKDKNVNLSATAASILLRICPEEYLNNLLKGLIKIMKEMSVQYRIDVVKSLVNVLASYPQQYEVINGFILAILREEQSEQLKREIIQVLNYQITNIGGEAKKACIQELAKLLSYAQYEKIHFQILGIINRETKAEDVTNVLLKNLVREIYLQEGSIRACGLSTLIKIAELNSSKKKLLEKAIAKFQKDRDQEVRERIMFKQVEPKLSAFELDMIEGYLVYNSQAIQTSKDSAMLSMASIKKWGEDAGTAHLKKKKKQTVKFEQKQKQFLEEENHYRQLFANHPTFKSYGPLRKMNNRVPISDPDGELEVATRIFLFENNLVIMYEIENKMKSTVLQNVKIDVKHSGQSFVTQHVIPAKQIGIQGKGESYVGLAISEESEQALPEQTIKSIAKFTFKEYSGQTLKATDDDSYSLEPLQIKMSTYLSPWVIEKSDFEAQWKAIKGEPEESTYQLNYTSKQAAVQELIKKYGMSCIANEETKNSRISLSLAGKYLGTYKTLVNLVIGYDTKLGCIVKISAKSDREGLAEELLAAIE